jgi:hypothetical protein
MLAAIERFEGLAPISLVSIMGARLLDGPVVIPCNQSDHGSNQLFWRVDIVFLCHEDA